MEVAHKNTETSVYARHQTRGSVYLVVADNSDDFPIALKYAGKMAAANQCHVGILHVIEKQDFLHWGKIEERMRQEQREEAERTLREASMQLEEYTNSCPALYIGEGGRMETLIETIESDPNITMLILAGGTQGSNPGPLVSYFTGKGLSRLRVPVMVVPDHLA